jgi:DNA invertase Pin-like site-specific DNA recombinase
VEFVAVTLLIVDELSSMISPLAMALLLSVLLAVFEFETPLLAATTAAAAAAAAAVDFRLTFVGRLS